MEQDKKVALWLDYAADNRIAGKTLRLTIGDQHVLWKVVGTGTWDDYRRVKVGALNLPAGTHVVTVRSDGPLDGPLIDIRQIEFVPDEPARAK